MITPHKPSPSSVDVTEDFPPFPPDGYQPVVNGSGIAYYRKGHKFISSVDSWVDPSYPEQARALCDDLGLPMGPTPSTTAMNLLRRALIRPLGTGYAFARQLEPFYAGGRVEVGKYGITTSKMTDVDFCQAYGTLLAEGPGDICAIGMRVEHADLIDATVRDNSMYPTARTRILGRNIYPRRNSVRGVFTSAELQNVSPIQVHQTYALERRHDIANVAEILLAARKRYPVAKLLINSLVGRLRLESSDMFIPVRNPKRGDVYVCPGVYAQQCAGSPRGALVTAIWITGTCRGELTSLLHELDRRGNTPLTWDTDGVLCEGEVRDSRWHRFKMKTKPISHAEIFSAKQNILVDDVGEVFVRSGGISGDPGPERLRQVCAVPRRSGLRARRCSSISVLQRRDGTVLGRALGRDGATEPYVAD